MNLRHLTAACELLLANLPLIDIPRNLVIGVAVLAIVTVLGTAVAVAMRLSVRLRKIIHGSTVLEFEPPDGDGP